MSLLTTIVILTTVTTLLSTIGAPAINALLWKLYTLFPSAAQAATRRQSALRLEVLKLRAGLAGTSSQDQFAKWARIRRTLDKKTAELEQVSAEVGKARAAFVSRAGVVRWVCTAGVRWFVQMWWAKQAVFWVPQGWLPSYVEWLLAFPRAPRGGVSVAVWGWAVNVVVRLIVEFVSTALKRTVGERVPQEGAVSEGQMESTEMS